MRPLGLPDDDDLDGPITAPAVEMLVQCVRRFDPEFTVTPDNRAALARSVPGWTDCRWHWSWPPHASSSSHPAS